MCFFFNSLKHFYVVATCHVTSLGIARFDEQFRRVGDGS